MAIEPPVTNAQAEQSSEEVFCYAHPKTPTRLRCSRCDRPICGRCSIPATVGQHCPECVAEARRSAPKVRSTFAALAPATRAIIITNVVVFLGQIFNPGLDERFASYAPAIFDGQWWRLITPMFLHAGGLHIFLNMYVLLIFGPVAERVFGTKAFLALYAIAGFTGTVASVTFGGCNFGVGASGAIFGLAGALLLYFWRRREMAAMRQYTRSIGIFIVANFILALGINFLNTGVQIDNFAHFGGLVGGGLVALGFDQREREGSLARGSVVAVAVVAASIALLLWRASNFSC